MEGSGEAASGWTSAGGNQVKARDMFRGAVRHAGAADRAGVRLEARYEEAVARLATARAGLSFGDPDDSGADGPSLPDLDGCPPEVVEECTARAAATLSPEGVKVRFDDLVSPLSAAEFFAGQYPHRRPILFRGPAERFGPLVEWTDLDELICTGRVNAADLALFMDGVRIPSELYAMTPYGSGHRQREGEAAMVDDRKLVSFLRQGATLVVDAVHKSLRSVAHLAHAFETALHSYSYINLYASWHSTRGFGTHWDDHDVYVVQVHGEKRWQLYGPTRKSPTRVDTALDDSTPRTPVWKGNLTAGDVFYIPRGWWHDARVLPPQRGAGSIHLTCQVRTVTGQDVLVWLGSKLAQHEQFRKDVPLMAAESQLAQYLEEFGSLVESVLRDATARELKDDHRSRWTERPATRFGRWIEPWKSPDWDRYRIALRGFDQAALRRSDEDDSVLLTANGWTHTLDPRCLALIQPLVECEAVAVGRLKAVDPGMFGAGFADDFVKALIRKAIVVVVPPRA